MGEVERQDGDIKERGLRNGKKEAHTSVSEVYGFCDPCIEVEAEIRVA